MDCQGNDSKCPSRCKCELSTEAQNEYKCAEQCKCPHKTESKSEVVLEDMLVEMLNMSAISNQSNKQENTVRVNRRATLSCPKIMDAPVRVNRRATLPCPEIMDIPMQEHSLIEDTTVPSCFIELEGENDEPEPRNSRAARQKRHAEAMEKFMNSGMKRSCKEITNFEEHMEATKDYDPEKAKRTINKNLQKMTEFQKNYPKSPPKKVEIWETPPICWTKYLAVVDSESRPAPKRTLEQTMNQITEEWGNYTADQRRNKNRRRRRLPPHCDQKVYPTKRYLP